MAAHGVSFAKPTIDIDKLRGFKEDVIGKLTNGLAGLAKQRKVTVAHGAWVEQAFAAVSGEPLTTAFEPPRDPPWPAI